MNSTNTTKVESNPNISMSYEGIAKKLGISVKEVKEAEKSALKKLRHPKIGKALKAYLRIGDNLEVNGF